MTDVALRTPAPNPLAGLAACFLLGAAALLARDPLTPVLLLVPTLALATTRLPLRSIAWRTLVVLVAGLGVGVSTALLAPEPGIAWARGVAMVLRVLAIAVPGALFAALIDTTALADGLVQQMRLPPRFAYGALAALRLLPLLLEEWRMIGLARRARGVGAGRNPVAAVHLFAGRVFALLVAAVRRSGRLATAMDARGFDAGLPRTFARPVSFARSDLVLMAGAAALAVAVTAAGILLGTWHAVWS